MSRKKNDAAANLSDLLTDATTAPAKPQRKPRGNKAATIAPAILGTTVPALVALVAVIDEAIKTPPAILCDIAAMVSNRKRGSLLTAHEKVNVCARVAAVILEILAPEHHADASRWLAEADAAARQGKADRETLAIIARLYGLASKLGTFKSLADHPHHAATYDATGALVMPNGAADAIDCGGFVVALDKAGRDMRTDGVYEGKGAKFAHLGERLTDRAAAGDIARRIALALGKAATVETTSEDTPAAE